VRSGASAPGRGRGAAALAAALALAAGVAAGAGCGKKGPPVPPETRLPAPVTDLEASVEDGAVVLAWTNPRRRADGSRLRDLAAARVFRREDPGLGPPPPALRVGDRIAGYVEVARVRLTEPPTARPPFPEGPRVEGDRVTLADRRDLTYGRRYTYVVLAEDAQGRLSPPGPRVSVRVVAPPEAPPAPRATAGEGEVHLAWAPPARFLDGQPVEGPLAYEVLRADAPEAPLRPVTPAPVEATAFTDRGLENDRTYRYAVRAVRRADGTLARGPASPAVTATPRDVTPPAPPTELVGVPSAGTVRLAWRPSPDPDVAAYVIYRAAPGGEFVRVGTVRPPATVFVDRDVPPGTWRYAVTAQDAAAHPNESARSAEITVTVP